jgi:hypothetical protein
MGADNQLYIRKNDAQVLNQALRIFEVGKVPRIDEYRVIGPVQEVVPVKVPTLNEKKIFKNFVNAWEGHYLNSKPKALAVSLSCP